MSLSAGTRIGPYEIGGQLGAGGMGEVYRARDTRLQREVAIKILPEIFAADPERLARFEREAQVLAALNHPHIAQIYGIEEGVVSGSSRTALVMELVDGETLADRLTRGRIALDEALAIAMQIADALDAAHERGIVHRDLKPANITVSDAGVVKVLDFGLAKPAERRPGASGPANAGHRDRAGARHDERAGAGHDNLTVSPTITSPALLTHAGVILGTAAYMAPEQARGKAVDKRADIWAVGVILYEMLTGRRPFGGETITDVFAATVKDEPDLGDIPPPAREVVAACLHKDPARRLRDLGDLPLLLRASSVDEAPARSRAWALPWAVAGVLFVASAALAWLHLREPAPELPSPLRFRIGSREALPPSAAFAISPDGRTIAHHAVGNDGVMRIWLRPLDAAEGHPLAGTEGANQSPIWWSADSRSIAFATGTGGTLKRIGVNGGAAQVICEVPLSIVGGSWNPDDVIIFGQNGGPLMRVSAGGGEAMPLTILDGERGEGQHAHPSFLPDGRHFVYRRVASAVVNAMDDAVSGVYLGSLDVAPDAQPSTRLLAASSSAMFAPAAGAAGAGHLLFMRNNTLMAQRFDAAARTLLGDPLLVADTVAMFNDRGAFSVSRNGRLVYRQGVSSGLSLAVFTPKEGVKQIGEQALYAGLALSPDGARAAVTRIGTNRDIWLYDVGRDVSTRFTFDSGPDDSPVWSPDGRTIVFRSQRGSAREAGLFVKPIDGARDEEPIPNTGGAIAPTDWSRDGRHVLYTTQTPDRRRDVKVLAYGARQSTTLLGTAFNEEMAAFSPDGRWIAYLSDESGRPELYVRRFLIDGDQPSVTGKWMLTSNGLYAFWWADDGRTIYVAPRPSSTNAVVLAAASGGSGSTSIDAIDVTATESEFTVSRPRPHMKIPGTVYGATLRPDGAMAMLVVPGEGDARNADLDVVVNWQEALAR